MIRHKVAALSKAANIPPARVQKLLERGLIKFTPSDRPASGSGSQHEFSRDTVISFAIIQRLVKCGVKVSIAAQAATQYSNHRAPDQEDPRRTSRLRAVLVGMPGGVRLVLLAPDTPIEELLQNESGVFILDCEKLSRQIDLALSNHKAEQ